MKQFYFLLMGIGLSPLLLNAQANLYEESHRETEYQYGVVEDGLFDSLTGLEQIKYNLNFTECRKQTTINTAYQMTLDVYVDTNSNEKAWMNPAAHFNYAQNVIRMWDRSGTLIGSQSFSDREIAESRRIQEEIRNQGYFPGIKEFPQLPDTLTEEMLGGSRIQKFDDGRFMISKGDESYEYDKVHLTIRHRWVDRDGYRVTDTYLYTLYAGGQGLLPAQHKTERVVFSVNGPCITETVATFFSAYQINDPGGLVSKAFQPHETITLSPNSNNGVFQVTVGLADESSIRSVEIVNVFTGQVLKVPTPANNRFNVDISSEPSGHYVIRVTTSGSVQVSHFIKN